MWPYLQALACALGTFLPVVPSFFFKPREWDGDGDDDDDDNDDVRRYVLEKHEHWNMLKLKQVDNYFSVPFL